MSVQFALLVTFISTTMAVEFEVDLEELLDSSGPEHEYPPWEVRRSSNFPLSSENSSRAETLLAAAIKHAVGGGVTLPPEQQRSVATYQKANSLWTRQAWAWDPNSTLLKQVGLARKRVIKTRKRQKRHRDVKPKVQAMVHVMLARAYKEILFWATDYCRHWKFKIDPKLRIAIPINHILVVLGQ